MTIRDDEIAEGMSISDALNRLTQLPDLLTGSPGVIPLTKRGRPIMALMSWDLFQSIMETMEIMADPDLMAQLKDRVKDIQEGRTRPLTEFAAELGIDLGSSDDTNDNNP